MESLIIEVYKMKKKLSLLLALALAFSIPIAATATTTPEIEWSKSFGGSGYDSVISSQQTTDGGYIMAVQSDSNDGDVAGNHGGYDAWIVKLTSNGEISWSKCLGGSNADCAYSIQQTNDGGYIVAGVSNSNDGDVSGNHGYNDYWVVKLNSNGEISWSKCLGGSGFDGTRIIQQTRDGGYCAACYSDSTDGDITKNHGIVDYWVAKFDNSGAISWNKCLGGSDVDCPYSVQQTSDGGYITAGESRSNDGDVTGNHGGGDAWVVKLESSTSRVR